MPTVVITLTDTPSGVAIHTDFKPAIGAQLSNAQWAALEIIRCTKYDWDIKDTSRAPAATTTPDAKP